MVDVKRGDWVYIHRRDAMGNHWHEGPGVVIMVSGATAWVSVLGELWKVPIIAVRQATSNERSGIEIAENFLPELREEIMASKRLLGLDR